MIKIDKLLVLKAFYLGYEIRENHFNEAEALKMVNRAIDYYESQNSTFSKSELKRKLFYLLIKCELLRHEDSVQGIRALTQKFAKSINNTVGFGIREYYGSGRVDYIVSGGKGITQERWIARLNGDDGSIIWDKTYNSSGNSYEFDGIRMTMVGSDN